MFRLRVWFISNRNNKNVRFEGLVGGRDVSDEDVLKRCLLEWRMRSSEACICVRMHAQDKKQC